MSRIQVFAHGLDFAVVEQHQQVVQIVIELPGPGHPVRLRFDRDTIVLGRRTCDCKSQPTRKVLGRVLDKPAIACLGVVRGIGIIRGPGDQLPGRVVRYAVPAERVATAELLEEIEYELTSIRSLHDSPPRARNVTARSLALSTLTWIWHILPRNRSLGNQESRPALLQAGCAWFAESRCVSRVWLRRAQS